MRKHVKGNVSWVGYIDWELESFHGDAYSIMNGSSQNAYLIEEEKNVLIENIRSQWNPEEEDLAGIPTLVTALIGKEEAEDAAENVSDGKAAKYQCGPCGYIYDPEKGDPDSGIAPGTAFEDLPDDWCCPVCGVSKDMFEKVK